MNVVAAPYVLDVGDVDVAAPGVDREAGVERLRREPGEVGLEVVDEPHEEIAIDQVDALHADVGAEVRRPASSAISGGCTKPSDSMNRPHTYWGP